MDSKDLIKGHILKQSVKLMNEYGYGALNLSELARYTNMTKQRLYYHYKTPEEIVLTLAETWGRSGQNFTMNALAETREVGAFKVLAMSKGLYNWMKNDKEMAKLGQVLFQTSPQLKKLNDLMMKIRETGRIRIKDFLLQESVFQKMKMKNLDEVVTALHSQLYGSYFYIITINDFKNIDQHEENCNRTLRRIIQSYLK